MTEFLSTLDHIDQGLTLLLNYDGGSFQDHLWLIVSSRTIWLLPALTLIAYLFQHKKQWREAVIVVLAIALTVTLCDQISSTWMKPFFGRLRPSHNPALEGMLHLVNGYRSGTFGFVSSHAANSFGAVTLVSLLLRSRKVAIPLYMFALCVSYSRVYLGVHYVGDTLGGMLLGMIIAIAVYALLPKACRTTFILPKNRLTQTKAILSVSRRLPLSINYLLKLRF